MCFLLDKTCFTDGGTSMLGRVRNSLLYFEYRIVPEGTVTLHKDLWYMKQICDGQKSDKTVLLYTAHTNNAFLV